VRGDADSRRLRPDSFVTPAKAGAQAGSMWAGTDDRNKSGLGPGFRRDDGSRRPRAPGM